jgi:hypothetical protein
MEFKAYLRSPTSPIPPGLLSELRVTVNVVTSGEAFAGTVFDTDPDFN